MLFLIGTNIATGWPGHRNMLNNPPSKPIYTFGVISHSDETGLRLSSMAD